MGKVLNVLERKDFSMAFFYEFTDAGNIDGIAVRTERWNDAQAAAAERREAILARQALPRYENSAERTGRFVNPVTDGTNPFMITKKFEGYSNFVASFYGFPYTGEAK